MAKIVLNFLLTKNHGFVLQIREKGNSNGNYATVEGLVNPDFTRWNKKEQRFIDATQEAIHNNNVLQEMRKQYQYFIDNGNPQTPADVKRMVKTGKLTVLAKIITFGDYLRELIRDMKNESVLMPSKNYQCYITLLHKLEKENRALNVPVSEINDTHFMAFASYVLKVLKGVNYVPLMKRFHAAFEKARKAKLTSNTLEYKFIEDKPRDTRKAAEKVFRGVDILTEKQYKKFCNMDLTRIPRGNKAQVKHMELYRDFCIMIYELKMRPCDVLKLHSSDIHDGVVIYWVTKKKNYVDEETAFVSTPLTLKAKEIMAKYKGKSSKGYIFPFALNEYDWDFKNAASYNKWNNKKQYTLERVNAFLKKVAVVLGTDRLTNYTFRHSTFTHKILQGANVMQLAKEGGTHVNMLEKHYFNHMKK